jgi:hypothetical protein
MCFKGLDSLGHDVFVVDNKKNILTFNKGKSVSINGWTLIRYEIVTENDFTARGMYLKLENSGTQQVYNFQFF